MRIHLLKELVGYVFLRNVIISAGNSGNKNLEKKLTYFTNHKEPLIRGSAVWSLGQLLSKNDVKTLKKSLLKSEKNSYVLFELNRFN